MPPGMEWLSALPVGAVAGIAVMWVRMEQLARDMRRLASIVEGPDSPLSRLAVTVGRLETQVVDLRETINRKKELV